MTPNANWGRWLFASISDHFNTAAIAAGIPMFIEGQHRDTNGVGAFYELRMDGPDMRQVSRGCWKLRIEVNVLIQTSMTDTDYHDHHQNIGTIAAAFDTYIKAYKYGKTTPDPDDQSQFGCLKLLQNARTRDFIETNHFHQIDVTTKLMQASVEGHYMMDLTTT